MIWLNQRDWLDLVEADIRKALMGTRMMDSPILRVSAKSGDGLPDLIAQLEKQLTSLPKRKDLGKPRLPIDRVFTIQGFGTIVTGTLLDGSLHSGDEIVIMPSTKTGKIRGLQTHKTKEDQAEAGQRTAVNLGGIDLDEVKRGDVLAHPNTYTPSRRVDAEIRLLKDGSIPLTHHTEVKFYLGAMETIGMVRLLDREVLKPGASGFVQLELREAVIAVPGDRFILRRPSPPETIGGGVIINAPVDRRYKRFDSAVLKSLAIKQAGDPAERYLQHIQSHFPISIANFEDQPIFHSRWGFWRGWL